MKARYLLFILSILFFAPAFSQTKTYTVEFEITNVRNAKGLISAAMYQGEETFPDKDKAKYTASVTARKGKVIIRFKNIPAGEYALAVFHDENANNDMDTNFVGIPKEGYGFSNNIRPRFGPPKYKQAKFRVNGDYSGSLALAY